MKVFKLERDSDAPTFKASWDWYVDTFSEIDEMSVNRHLMSAKEFYDVWFDERVQKWFAMSDDEKTIIGMSAITNDLDAWPLISPRYFRKHYPVQYQNKAVWYIGFVGVHPQRREIHAFREMISQMYPQVNDSNGIAVMDFSSYNVEVRRIPVYTKQLLKQLNPNVSELQADAQSFFIYRF